MVKLDPVEVLKKHGIYSDELQTRMDIVSAVMNKDWENPALTKNMTREQIEQMKSEPQMGGAFPMSKSLLSKAKEVTAMPEAKDIAEQGASIAKEGLGAVNEGAAAAKEKLGAMKESAKEFAANPRAAVQEKIGKFVNEVPAVQNLRKKFEGKDPVTGLARELDYEKSDGFMTMIVKMFLNTITDIMSSPLFPTYVRALFGFMFVLSYLQGLPIFGGLIRAALEITTFIVTTTGTTILSLGNMAGPPGHIIGLIFASVFFVLSAMISFSRKQFTDAIVVSANLIPFIGMPISGALQRADIAGKKLYEAQKKVYDSFIDLLGAVFNIKGRVRGGIRFSRRRKNTKKWRTQRRHNPFGTR
jgi:hypothetical protein